MRGVRLVVALTLAALSALLVLDACGHASAPSPFAKDASADTDSEAGDATDEIDPTLGGPCLDDAQCDDGFDCTFDHCDATIARCRFSPDDSKCQDEQFCNGSEVCEPGLGCRSGLAVACSDDDTCTIDECIEATKSCSNVPRDADGDGDPDWSCGGGDCNDTDPTLSSKQLEICGNQKDDDCDGAVDESDCTAPAHDTCADALDITAGGKYTFSLAAAASDYAVSCGESGPAWRDVVAAIVVPAGAPKDVDVIATSSSGPIAIAAAGLCGDASSEIACGKGYAAQKGGIVARVRLRSLAPGAYPLYVLSGGSSDVVLTVSYLSASSAPANETCGTAAAITAGSPTDVSVVDAAKDLVSTCSSDLGELVYSVTLTAPQDVHVWGTSKDGYGAPLLELWNAPCAAAGDELGCNTAVQAHLFERALAPGTYYLGVSATAPSDLSLQVDLLPPTTPPPDEDCASGAVLALGTDVSVPLDDHTDDIQLGCLPGAVDAAYAVDLAQKSDLLIEGRISNGDNAGLSLAKPACASSADELACGTGQQSPLRVQQHALAAGSYRAVIESQSGAPTILTAFARPAVAPVLVAFADGCADAVAVPPGGGFFQGTSANSAADYDAGCDLGSQGPGGAPDQMLKLDLASQKRVVLDMQGSSYNTLLVVRQAVACPGPEVTGACAAGYGAARSFLDLTLDAGSYFVQIDGYAGASGSWFLDVFVVDP
jgi:Putative metal-binding motif